jgi:protein-S-isoprenylcysteine O-methyltransferase Ste14
VREGHQLVQTGPYAIVRHPIYTGMFAAILGATLTLGTLASWIAVAAGLFGILLRVDVEERLMASEFGAAHADYRARTRKLIPFVW